MAKARARVPESLEGFTRSDWERVIREAALGKENTQIAEMYLLDGIPHVEIGTEFGLSRSAVSKRIPGIIDKIERTAKRIGIL